MQIILADNQAIYRAGIARILMAEQPIRVVAQCANLEQLREVIGSLPRSIVVFPSSITSELGVLLDEIRRMGSRSVMILEQSATVDESLAKRLEGILLRSAAGQQLVDCLYRVAAGERYVQRAVVKTMPSPDNVGAIAVRRLTPKELQIVALISVGCKNRQIATQLGTTEQVVKNYLRSIYVKTGVSDRLELALFTVRHRELAEVVEATRLALMRTA